MKQVVVNHMQCSAFPGVRRVGLGLSWVACILLAFPLVSCQSTEFGSDSSEAENWRGFSVRGPEFSSAAAWKHMRALNQLGSRVSGSAGSAAVRQYLRQSLRKFDIALMEHRVSVAVVTGRTVELTHLIAVIPGRSRDVLLLAAHYDTPPEEALPPGRHDQRASGAALLLELAGSLDAGQTPPYTIWLSFIDGDSLEAGPDATPRVRLGSQSLLDEWTREQEFSRIRAAIFFGNIGDRDRPIVRDVDSPRVYREIFWEAASDLGYSETFPPDSHYEELATGRVTFAQAPLRASIALANQRSFERADLDVHLDPASPDSQEPKSPAETGGRNRRPSAGFEAIGKVTLEALSRIAFRLQKIDQFAQSPLTAGRETSRERVGRD